MKNGRYKLIIMFSTILTLFFSGCGSQTDTQTFGESVQHSDISESEVSEIKYDQTWRFSDEYRSCKYYDRLMSALQKNKNAGFLQRVLDTALSQEGYLAYSLENMDIEQVREEGNLWTGAVSRYGSDYNGNTEYIRWFQEYVMKSGNPYMDYEWCSVFVSWCLYQAGYHSDTDSDPEFYFSYCADPRNERKDTLIQAFNFDQDKVWYTPAAQAKLDEFKDCNTPVHTDIDPYEIDYKPGGLIFISWDGTGGVFDHIGIVVDYDTSEHILTYIGGNDYNSVMINSMDYDLDTFDVQPIVKNSNRIMAYAEYSAEQPDDDWYNDLYSGLYDDWYGEEWDDE